MSYEGNGKYARILKDVVTDGEGVRVSIYVSGCSFHCAGCFNKSIWHFDNGEIFGPEVMNDLLIALDKSYIQGLSILGGEPLQNLKIIRPLIHSFRDKFGYSKDIWIWSGYMKEYIEHTPELAWILDEIDVLIDGPFVLGLKSLDLPFRGSYNQRIHELR